MEGIAFFRYFVDLVTHLGLPTTICGLSFTSSSTSPEQNYRSVTSPDWTAAFQDSLPPLHTIKGKYIDSLTPSFENQTLTVKLKNGTTYVYQHEDWDFEDYNSSINQRLKEAIQHMQMTFTKVEHAPEFPGGDEAWNKYIQDFCSKHRADINDAGAAEIMIKFIVHMKGQIVDVTVQSNKSRSTLESLAMQAIQDGPPWIPATQNGHKVVSYKVQAVRLGL